MVGRLSCPVAWGVLVPSQGSNPHPQHWKADSSPLDHQGSPSENFCSPLAFNQWEGSILSACRAFPRCLLSAGRAAGRVSDLDLLCPLPGHQHQQSYQCPGGPREGEARPAYPPCGCSPGPLGEVGSVRHAWRRWTWGAAGTVDGPVRCGPHGLVPASLGLFQTLSPAWGRPLIVLGRWAWHGNGA